MVCALSDSKRTFIKWCCFQSNQRTLPISIELHKLTVAILLHVLYVISVNQNLFCWIIYRKCSMATVYTTSNSKPWNMTAGRWMGGTKLPTPWSMSCLLTVMSFTMFNVTQFMCNVAEEGSEWQFGVKAQLCPINIAVKTRIIVSYYLTLRKNVVDGKAL